MNIITLHQLFLNSNSACTDTRKLVPGDMYFALKGDNFNGNHYVDEALKKGAKYAIVDEEEFNTSNKTILVTDVLQTLQELATTHRDYLNIPIIAITGSNGKTTTKELINATLSEKFYTAATIGNLNNHIGVPLTLLSMNKEIEIGIVEMGANHIKEIDFLCNIAKPDYGYITNFGKAHLEGFGSVEGIIKGKTELYNYLIKNDRIIFINNNDSIQIEKTKQAKIVSFGNKSSDVTIELISASPFVKLKFNETKIESQLIGEYNFTNISAAITIANYFKVEDLNIKDAIENYLPTDNRSQIITKESNKIILDAYNANPSSMHAALTNFNNLKDVLKIAILGDMFELGEEANKEHQNITNLVSTYSIDKAILIGENFYRTEINSSNSIAYRSFEDFKNQFKISELNNATLLIKGSRGMALERIVDLID